MHELRLIPHDNIPLALLCPACFQLRVWPRCPSTPPPWSAVVWCVLQLFRAPRGRIQPLSQMGQDLHAHDRKWLEGLPRKQGTRSLETMTETNSFRNGSRTRDLWKSTRVRLPSLAA